jgi:c-di-GMP-binding flagellar brake protein YcgR
MPPVGDAHAALVVAAVCLLALAVFEALRARSGSGNAVAWDRFHLAALERGLGEADTAALASWARRAALVNPVAVLLDRAVFDRFIRDRLGDLDRTNLEPSTPASRRLLLDQLGALRHRLGHDPLPPPAPLVSSRDLLPGVKVTVRPDQPSSGPVPPGRLVVRRVDEEAIELAPIDGDPSEKAFYDVALPGRAVWAVFGRAGETTYRFRARLLERPGVEIPSLVLGHGDFLVREERRKTPRVLHRFPVSARIQSMAGEAVPERALELRTVDISWGGLGFLGAEAVPRGSRLALELPLDSERDTVPVTVRVVGTSVAEEAGASVHTLNTQFVDMSPAVRTRLQVFLGAAHRQLKAAATAGTTAAAPTAV